MKITVYKCDTCDKVLSADKEFKKHLSLENVGSISFVEKIGNGNYHGTKVLGGFKQFCDTLCLASFINTKIMNYEQTKISRDISND